MKLSLREIKILDCVVYSFLGVFFAFSTVASTNWDFSFAVNLSFYFVGLLSFFRIVSIKRNISLLRNFYIFQFIFLFYAAFVQYGNSSNIWAGVGLNVEFADGDYLFANLIILVFDLTLEFFYYFFKPKKSASSHNFVFSNDCFTLFNAINFAVLLYLLATNNVDSVSLLDSSDYNLSVQIVNILKFIPVSSLLLSITFRDKSNFNFYGKISVLFYFAVFAILFWPFYGSVSRYLIFGCYLCVLTLLFSNCKFKSIYFLMYVFGFLVLFSSFNYFKYNSGLDGFTIHLSNMCGEDFDAYQLIMVSVKYAHEEGFLFGGNVISALFCFIPRSIWGSKCLPSGEIMFSYFGASFSNVSCPIFGEAFISFGVVGVLIFAALLGMGFKILDSARKKSYLRLIFIVISGFEIYLIRGALLPTWSYTFANILSLSIMYGLLYLFKNRNYRRHALWKKSTL